jgi:hypothetical protein
MINHNPPSLIHGAVMGAIATSFLAGPTFCLIAAADHLLGVGDMPSPDKLLAGLLVASLFGTIVGLLGAIPASVANATILLLVARQDFDGWHPAILSGALCGVIVAPGGLKLFMSKEGAGYWGSGDNVVEYVLCLAATGALMGLIHWFIAIRPRRKLRLAQRLDV